GSISAARSTARRSPRRSRQGSRGSISTPAAGSASRSPGTAIPPIPPSPAPGRAIMAAVAPNGARAAPLLLMIDGDVGKTMGRILTQELGLACDLVSIDGVALQDLDFVDVGAPIMPPGVEPVV